MVYEIQEVVGRQLSHSVVLTGWIPPQGVCFENTMLESECPVAGEIVPLYSEIQTLLDTPTTHWDDISEAGLDRLSDVHLMTLAEQPTTTPEDYAIQLRMTNKLELPLAVLQQSTWKTK